MFFGRLVALRTVLRAIAVATGTIAIEIAR
jgi:hypothetical protein